jgi:signal peptidase I
VKTKQRSAGGSLVELVVIVAVALGLALGIQQFLVKPYRIPSESMVPTLEVGQRVLVNRIGHRFGDPKVGDIVVFHPPRGSANDACGNSDRPETAACDRPTGGQADVNFIKRVVAGPGDTISIVRGRVIRNGKRQNEPYIANTCADDASRGCNLNTPIRIPPDHWFMMGDNRGESDDSRFWGPVPRDSIIGGAFATYWPPNRIGLL